MSKLAVCYQSLWSWVRLLHLSFLETFLTDLKQVLLVITSWPIQSENTSVGLCFKTYFYLPWTYLLLSLLPCWPGFSIIFLTLLTRWRGLLLGLAAAYSRVGAVTWAEEWCPVGLHPYSTAGAWSISQSGRQSSESSSLHQCELGATGWAVADAQAKSWAPQNSFLSWVESHECWREVLAQLLDPLVLHIRDADVWEVNGKRLQIQLLLPFPLEQWIKSTEYN